MVFMLCFACCSQNSSDSDNKAGLASHIPQIEVKTETDRTSADVATPVTYSITAIYTPKTRVLLPEPGSVIAGLRVVDFGEDGPHETDNRIEHKKWYKLRADIAGTYIIPSMTVFSISDNGTEKELKTPQIFLNIGASLNENEGEQLQDIIDIKPLREIPRDFTVPVLAGIATIMAAICIAGAFFYIKKKKAKKTEIQKPAHIVALEALKTLQKEKLVEKGVVREHYFRLSDIFRQYIENRFRVSAIEQTTPELLSEVANIKNMTAAVKTCTGKFLLHSDMVKFAKYSPEKEEIDRSHQEIITVINDTKQEELISATEKNVSI
jgi:hypothetical protein